MDSIVVARIAPPITEPANPYTYTTSEMSQPLDRVFISSIVMGVGFGIGNCIFQLILKAFE